MVSLTSLSGMLSTGPYRARQPGGTATHAVINPIPKLTVASENQFGWTTSTGHDASPAASPASKAARKSSN
ncbi:hypothetical protein GCM10027452_10930 [Micromonospora halotolerans]